ELSGEKVIELLSYLAKSKTAHPISKQLELHLNDRGEIAHASIAQKPIDVSKSYFVATSDFLANGGDHMDFFKNPINTTDIEYLLRNEIIDYFMKTDTFKASVDHRFIQIKSFHPEKKILPSTHPCKFNFCKCRWFIAIGLLFNG